MGNYFNELRWKIIIANNLQFIHKVTIEFRFRKSFAQERFKSNLGFRYQIIVLSMKFRNGFAKFMIPIALFKKFLSYQFIVSVEVSNIARCSSKTNELRDIIIFVKFWTGQSLFNSVTLKTTALEWTAAQSTGGLN